MASYLDGNGLLYFWQKIKNAFAAKSDAIKNITRSGTTFTATRADGTTFTFTQQDNNTTYTAASATPKMDGTGAVGTSAKYAREDHVHPKDTTKADVTNTVTNVSMDNQYRLTQTINGATTVAGLNVAVVNVLRGFPIDGKTPSDQYWLTSSNSGTVVAMTPQFNILYLIMADQDSTGTKENDMFVWGGTQNGFVKVSSVFATSNVSTSDPGLMSAEDKTKLDGIAAGAEVNQNAFGKFTGVSYTDSSVIGTVEADEESDTLYLKYYNSASDNSYTHIRYKYTSSLDMGTSTGIGTEIGSYDLSHPVFGQGYGECTTANGTAAKVAALSDYVRMQYGIVSIKFTADVDANATLNINNCGALPIKFKGSAITAGVINAGDVATFMLIQPAMSAWYELIAKTTAEATSSAAGMMSAADKSKLDGIAAGAEVNQNAFSSVKVGSTTIAADGKTDTLELVAGSNVTITPDATNDKVTIAATNTKYTAASATPLMDGTGAVGTSAKYAREDHVHPSDTSKVPTTRTVNGKALSGNITLSASDVSAIPSSEKGAASGVCPLNASSKIDATYLPSYVDDVIEAYPRSGQTELSKNWLATGSASGTVIAPEAGKIYVLMAGTTNYAANSQFRWGGSAYVLLQSGEGISAITNSEIDTIVAS